MHNKFFFTIVASMIALSPAAYAQEQDPTPEEIINSHLDYLCKYIEFDEVQLYYVDSTLQYDIPKLMDELSALRAGGVANSEAYQAVSDKWMEEIDRSYQSFFTEDQWARYLKTTYGRERKARQKRMAKRQQ